MDHDLPSIPDYGAQLDQARAAFRDLAPLMRSYFDALIEQGFTEFQALTLVSGYQSVTLTAAFGGRS